MFDAPAAAVDLDAYFKRIGYDGPREPTLAVLRAITQKHPDAIPFENLDVLLGRGISLVPADIDAKLIGAGRGGYCYEQNNLLKRVLTALGFEVEGLMARVQWMAPDGAPRPRSHMVLGVAIDGETWLADSGFGGCVLTGPLRLFSDAVQDTPNGKFRIVDAQCDGVIERQVQADLSGRWAPLYQVARGAWADIDYEQANYFTYSHPSSHFTWSMTVGRTTPAARYALKNNRFTHRDVTGAVVEQRDLSADELETTLRDVIGLPVAAEWRPVIEKVVAWGTPS